MADNRARITCKSGYTLPLRGPASVLFQDRGIVFPYTPDITTQKTVEYMAGDMPHTNFQQQSFVKSRLPSIQITGQFIHQVRSEAIYTAGVLHFLKVVTKMHSGVNDPLAGTPPPVLNFSAYGALNYKNVPVVISSYSYTTPSDQDMVSVTYTREDLVSPDGDTQNSNLSLEGQTIQLPVMLTISLDLVPQYSYQKADNDFNLQDFATGALYNQGFI